MLYPFLQKALLAAGIAVLGANAASVVTITTNSQRILATSLNANNPPSLPTSCAATSAPAAPKQTVLTRVRTTTISVPRTPFGLAFANNDYALVALPQGPNSTLGVLDTKSFKPKLIHQIPLPKEFVALAGGLDLTLTKDKQHVFIAAGPGGVIVDVQKAISGRADAVVGTLDGGSRSPIDAPGYNAIQIVLTPDEEYAFISQEGGYVQTGFRGDLDVFKLSKPKHGGSVNGTHIGFLELGYGVVGSVISPDGCTLYTTSEAETGDGLSAGFVSVVDVETLQTSPAKALRSRVGAACGPVRAILTPNGKTLWTTARESDLLLAFDTEKLVSKPKEALIAQVTVGTAPVGLTFACHGSRILTADSNRFNASRATTGISVIDVDKALAGKKANLGRIPTGLFPREFAISPDGRTVLVSDNQSKQVQAIDVSTLP